MQAHRSQLRLIVIQALIFSLLLTLGARLYYLQVMTGETYQGRAAAQSVRDVVIQPQRGLIVDAQGRPLAANRLAWVVTVDRSALGRMSADDQDILIGRVADVVGTKPGKIRRKLTLCGTEGARAGECWNGSPFQPIPVAQDIPDGVAVRILEQAEEFPTIHVEQQSLRQYPKPHGVNAAHLLGYLSPITRTELEAAEAAGDASVNGASVVGRAGVERTYDPWLRGQPGHRQMAVDSMGRVLGEVGRLDAQPGDTLVTSIDARVQAVAEEQLRATIMAARETRDRVSGRNFVADSGAVVVMEAQTGRIVAMASEPTYEPEVWVGGITDSELAELYSEAAGTPLLSRAVQGQFAPGSTWKPFMTAGALTNGYRTDARLNCSSAYRVGNRDFRNYESGAYGSIGFDRALEVSCNTFFYRIGHDYWRKFGSNVADVDARDPLVEAALEFGFGAPTGIDVGSESSGRIADRQWKHDYYEQQKEYYCAIAEDPGDASDFLRRFAREFCIEGYAYRAGDAVNFSIGQGDTMVTPLQLARGYAALVNGGALMKPRVGKAIVAPDGTVLKRIRPEMERKVDVPQRTLAFIDQALLGTSTRGTMAWRLGGFPLQEVPIRSKTGSAEVQGKQSTSWLATYTEDYVVVMMVSQAGTGSGTSGPAVRAIWESLYGVEGGEVVARRTAIPGVIAGNRLPVFGDDGSILPPARTREDQ